MNTAENQGFGSENELPIEFKTVYDELAEMDELHPFLNQYLERRYKEDAEFRNKMFDAMYQHANEAIPQVEHFLLEKLCESLGYFLEYTRPCRTQNQKH